MRGLLRPWISCSLGKTVPAGPGPRARPGETANAWRAIPIYNTSGRDKEIGRLHWPQWATETGGVQAGQDLAWGGLNRGTGAGACCSASPVPVPRVVPQLHCPTLLQSYGCTPKPQSPFTRPSPLCPLFLLPLSLASLRTLLFLHVIIMPLYQRSSLRPALSFPPSSSCSGLLPELSRCLSSTSRCFCPGCGRPSVP